MIQSDLIESINLKQLIAGPTIAVSLLYHAVRCATVLLDELHTAGQSNVTIQSEWPAPRIDQLERAADTFCATPLR